MKRQTLIILGCFAVTGALLSCGYVSLYMPQELTLFLRLMLYLASVSGVVLVALILWYVAEKVLHHREVRLTARAERWGAERQALVIFDHAPASNVAFRSTWDPASRQPTTENLTLTPQTHINGQALPAPNHEETQRWLYFYSQQKPGGTGGQILEALPPPSLELPHHVDLKAHAPNPSIRQIFLGMGKFPDGQVRAVQMPLSRLTHIAVAGASGFGKSVQLEAMAWQFLHAREQVQVVLLDGQGTTFSAFDGHPALLYPIVSTETDIQRVLVALIEELERRDGLLSQWSGVKDLSQYNQVAAEALPIIPIIFDEFGLLGGDKEVVKQVQRIAAAGRKCGMFTTFAAQVWNATAISTAIRGNLATTIQFYARDKAQSRVLLGDSVAAEIERPGQAYASLPGVTGLVELQSPILTDTITPTRRDPSIGPDLPQLPEPAEDDADRLFRELVESGESRRQASLTAYNREYAGAIVTRGRRALGEL